MYRWIVIILLPIISQAAAPTWDIETVDRAAKGNRVVQISLRPDGSQHLVYTGCPDTACNESDLYYAGRKENGAWNIISVDHAGTDTGTGWFPSLSFDHQGLPHIFYANHEKQRLMYATANANGQWTKERISSGRGGWWTSSAAANGRVFVAHARFPKSGWENAALEVGTLVNGQWTFEVVDPNRNAGFFTSTALLPDGSPVISYNSVFDQPIGAIKVTFKKNDKWQIVDIDDISIKHHVAVDSQGFIHLIYQKLSPLNSANAALHDLMYATNAPNGVWKREAIQAGGVGKIKDTGTFPRITVDSKGGLHVAYVLGQNELAYGRKLSPSSNWEFYPVDQMGASIYPWIETDAKGQVHIAWEKSGKISYAVCHDCANK